MVSRDPALLELLAAQPDYPGASAQLDAADRAWLRARGVVVPPPEPVIPLHEAARIARIERRNGTREKKRPT